MCYYVWNPADEIADKFFDGVPGMVEAFGGGGKRFQLLTSTTEHRVFAATVRRHSFTRKEKQVWVIRGKKIKAKRNNRKRPSLTQRKNEN